jgi:glutamate N-acetyltransferase / amino-acid N-acetyltransferase
VVSAGDAIEFDPVALNELVQGDEIDYELTLPGEGGATEVFFSDLGPEYATFNASYTS